MKWCVVPIGDFSSYFATFNITIVIKYVTAFAVAYFFILSFFIKKIISYSVKIVDKRKLNVLYSCK